MNGLEAVGERAAGIGRIDGADESRSGVAFSLANRHASDHWNDSLFAPTLAGADQPTNQVAIQ